MKTFGHHCTMLDSKVSVAETYYDGVTIFQYPNGWCLKLPSQARNVTGIKAKN